MKEPRENLCPNRSLFLPTILLSLLPPTAYAIDSDLVITPADSDPSNLQLEILSSANAQHDWIVESSTDLLNWLTIGTVRTEEGIDTVIADSLSVDEAPIFYRARTDEGVDAILNLPENYYNYANIELPDHLDNNRTRDEDNTPNDNPITDAGATLGRVLFYDPRLSRNYTISCSSCHLQENAFTDPATFSVGFEGGLTGRNSMGLTNAKFYEPGHFFWDERADTLEVQTLLPIQDEVEMGMNLEDLVERLGEYEYYAVLFEDAFGDAEITTDRISRAISQFVRSMVSFQSKFDVGEATNFSNFTTQELRGRQLFNSNRANCNNCHEGPNFVGDEPENNGLEFPFIDLGVGGVNGNQRDDGKFKMSSLRNIEVTGPYMHDGRFDTLEEVIDHYSTGIVANPNLGNQLENNNQPIRPNFTDNEKADLIAFLLTLTDEAFLTDPKYSDPFRETD